MRRAGVALMGVVGFALACGGPVAQTEEAAWQLLCDAPTTCTTCPGPEDPAYLDALLEHALPKVEVADVQLAATVLETLSVDAQLEAFRADSKGKVEECALTGVLEKRLAAAMAVEIPELCALHTTCESFVGTDPTSVVACAEESLPGFMVEELRRMDMRSSVGLAKGLESFAHKHGTAGCALSIVLRDAR